MTNPAPLFASPDLSRMTLAERCAYYAEQIAIYERDITDRTVLDLTDMRAVLIEASRAIGVGGL